MIPTRVPSAEEILSWIQQETPLLRIEARRDVLPSGLSMAMMPALVSWKRSRIEDGPDGFYLVHNVNVASNPVAGTIDLATVRIPRRSVRGVEFVMVPARVLGVDTLAGHGQIRFLFDEEARPIVYANSGEPLTNHPQLEDLVCSWEAWRPPAAAFDGQKGLDPRTYALTMRCSHGPERFLSDGLQNRPWVCYPMKLPSIPHVGDEILHTCLLLGDSLARHTFARILDAGPAAPTQEGGDRPGWRRRGSSRSIPGAELPADYPAPVGKAWAALRERLEAERAALAARMQRPPIRAGRGPSPAGDVSASAGAARPEPRFREAPGIERRFLGREDRAAIRAAFESDRAAEDPVLDVLGPSIGYHLLLRSCITMALTTIDLGVDRAYRKAGKPRKGRIAVAPGELPDWMDELSHADMAGLFQRLPYALAWLAEHHRVIPAAAYQILRDAGLLHRRNGRTVRHTYDLRRKTPYGRLADHLIQ